MKTDENYGIKGQLRTVQGSKVGVCIPDNGRGRAKLKVLNGNEVSAWLFLHQLATDLTRSLDNQPNHKAFKSEWAKVLLGLPTDNKIVIQLYRAYSHLGAWLML